jgi:phosphoserine phosphatase
MNDSITLIEPDWVSETGGSSSFAVTLLSPRPLQDELDLVETILGEAVKPKSRSINASSHRFSIQCNAERAWELFGQLRRELTGIDIAVCPTRDRPYRLLICDMDKTIVDAETLDEVGELLGIGDEIAAITHMAMRGEVDFREALHERVQLLKGQPVDLFTRVLADCPIMPGAEALLQGAKSLGMHSILVSGGFAQIAMPIAQRLGFEEVYCNQLILDQGLLSGEVSEPIVNAEYKCDLLKRRASGLGIALDDCCAIGDGANDIPMIEAAGLGIAYHGKPAMRAVSTYQINHSNLASVLPLLAG